MDKLQPINESNYTNDFMQSIPDEVLVDIVNNNIDFLNMVKAELVSRGLDDNGKFVGTAESSKIHV